MRPGFTVVVWWTLLLYNTTVKLGLLVSEEVKHRSHPETPPLLYLLYTFTSARLEAMREAECNRRARDIIIDFVIFYIYPHCCLCEALIYTEYIPSKLHHLYSKKDRNAYFLYAFISNLPSYITHCFYGFWHYHLQLAGYTF